MLEGLFSEALCRALAVRQPTAGLLVHSVSCRGNCYDNTHAESFWSHLKAELLDGDSFRNLTEARLEISHYIAYYKAERRYLSLGYVALNHFETHFQTTSRLCAT